jgi:coenzyme PQQ precursor peptide PqqA
MRESVRTGGGNAALAHFIVQFSLRPIDPSRLFSWLLALNHWDRSFISRFPHCFFCTAAQIIQNKSLAKFYNRIRLSGEDDRLSAQPGEMEMAWKTPKIVEVPVGMEINMYACAVRK